MNLRFLPLLAAVAALLLGPASEAQARKRLALGQLDTVTAAWSITVTDCPYCLGGGQVDVSSGSLTSRGVQVDVRNLRGRPGDTHGRPRPAAGLLQLVGGRPNIDPLPQCAGPDIDGDSVAHRYSLDVSFTRAVGQLELRWTVPYCSGQIDGTAAQAMPTRASVGLGTLKQSRYSIRFLDTVQLDVVPDPSKPDEHWRGTIAYDATLRFAHRCIRQGNGTRVCV
jgi:hypothetical protein